MEVVTGEIFDRAYPIYRALVKSLSISTAKSSHAVIPSAGRCAGASVEDFHSRKIAVARWTVSAVEMNVDDDHVPIFVMIRRGFGLPRTTRVIRGCSPNR